MSQFYVRMLVFSRITDDLIEDQLVEGPFESGPEAGAVANVLNERAAEDHSGPYREYEVEQVL